MVTSIEQFVEQRVAFWDEVESQLMRAKKNGLRVLTPLELRMLGDSYRRLTSDLAYCQTHFPNSQVTTYLNQLVARTHSRVYRGSGLVVSDLWGFFTRTYPQLFRKNFSYFAVALFIFVASAALGFALCIMDQKSAEAFGLEHVVRKLEMKRMWTEEINQEAFPSSISALIFLNNIGVTFYAFALGITFGLGTVLLLVTNGLLFGAVSGLCLLHDMMGPFLYFVTAHGVLELSMVFIGSAAGLILADALVAGGELSRYDALRTRGKEAIRLVLGAAPFLVVAGFIEGHVSPSPVYPGAFKIAFGLMMGVVLYLYLWQFGRAESNNSESTDLP